MRYFIKFNDIMKPLAYMMYENEVSFMTEVTKEEYYQIRQENGIVESIPEQMPTEADRMSDIETLLADMIGGAL